MSQLHDAITAGNLTQVIELINSGADIYECNAEGISTLDLARQKGHQQIIDILLSMQEATGRPIESCSTQPQSPPAGAKAPQHPQQPTAALKNRALRWFQMLNNPAISLSAEQEIIKLTDEMLGLGWNPAEELSGEHIDQAIYPIILAARYGSVSLLRKLIENGADVNMTDEEEGAALHVACKHEHTECVKLLLDCYANTNVCGMKKKVTPIYHAAQSGNAEIVAMLLEKGANPSSDALESAVAGGRADLVAMLLKKYANPSSDALKSAIAGGRADLVAMLLKNGATPSADALTSAVARGHADIVAMLLEKGAKPSDGIEAAASGGHADIVAMLLKNGATPSADALTSAVAGGRADIVAMLLEKGAKPSDGIEAAARGGHADIVAMLLEKGAFVERKDSSGNTLLHLAARSGVIEVVSVLIKNGAKVNALNKYAETPLVVASNDATKAILRAAGGDKRRLLRWFLSCGIGEAPLPIVTLSLLLIIAAVLFALVVGYDGIAAKIAGNTYRKHEDSIIIALVLALFLGIPLIKEHCISTYHSLSRYTKTNWIYIACLAALYIASFYFDFWNKLGSQRGNIPLLFTIILLIPLILLIIHFVIAFIKVLKDEK